jgi:hypothetical protein
MSDPQPVSRRAKVIFALIFVAFVAGIAVGAFPVTP